MGLKRILLVEDDPGIRETLQLALQSEGYDVLTAANGKEGLELLGRSGPGPCLILLDLMMPVMNGVEFLSLCRGDLQLAQLPVVIVSAFHEMRKDLDDKKLKTQGFIKKPVDLDLLFDWVKRYCGTP